VRHRLLSRASLVLVLAGVTPVPADETGEQVLRKSDLGAWAPESFRAHIRITAPQERPEPLDVEVWRSGESRTLVRFLDPKERGKFLLRRDDALWFLSPSAKKPVKLHRAYRLRGSASLDDILGMRYSRDYAVVGMTQEDGLALLDLKAKAKGVPHPRVRYVVRVATHRPVRAEYRLASGKTSLTAEFLEWDEKARPLLKRLVLRDGLRGGGTTEVVVLEMEERPVAAGLFDLADGSARKTLEP